MLEEYTDMKIHHAKDDGLSTVSNRKESQNKGRLQINTSLTNCSYSSDDEESIVLDSSPQSYNTKSSQNLTGLSYDEEIITSPGKSFVSDSLNELSFTKRDIKSKLSEAKTAEFKALLEKVNEVYLNWKVKEFVLDTVKTKSTSWSQQVQKVDKTTEIQCNIHLQSENDVSTNFLGLEEEDIKLSNSRFSALINKSSFRHHSLEVVKANLAKLKLQKRSLQDEFGAHSMKVMMGVMTREQLEQLELQRHAEDLMSQARQLLSRNHTITEQLAVLRPNSERNLQQATYRLLQNKALYLHTVTSILKEKLDQSFSVDENMREKIDSEGDNLKTQVSEMRENLKALQKTLVEYEKKEASSEIFKKIVIEYGKLKNKLGHKNETLKLLSDPNMAF